MKIRNPYRILGIGLAGAGAVLGPIFYFIVGSPALTAAAISAIILGMTCVAIANARPYLSPEAAQILLKTGMENTAALLEELGLRNKAVYLPGDEKGRSKAIIPLNENLKFSISNLQSNYNNEENLKSQNSNITQISKLKTQNHSSKLNNQETRDNNQENLKSQNSNGKSTTQNSNLTQNANLTKSSKRRTQNQNLKQNNQETERLIVRYGKGAEEMGIAVRTPGHVALEMLENKPGAAASDIESALSYLLTGVLDVAGGVHVNLKSQISNGKSTTQNLNLTQNTEKLPATSAELRASSFELPDTSSELRASSFEPPAGGTVEVVVNDPRIAYENIWYYHSLGSPIASIAAAVTAEAMGRGVVIESEDVSRGKTIILLDVM